MKLLAKINNLKKLLDFPQQPVIVTIQQYNNMSKQIQIDLRKPEQKPLYFRDVKFDAFFIDTQGRLCQRFGDRYSYNVIADKNGKNCNRANDVKVDMPIDRLIDLQFSL
jgi:hypothetical protein